MISEFERSNHNTTADRLYAELGSFTKDTYVHYGPRLIAILRQDMELQARNFRPSSMGMPIGSSPHHCSPIGYPPLCKNEYLVLSLGRETAARAVVGAIVWAFRRRKKPRSRGMSARGYALLSVCLQLSFSFPINHARTVGFAHLHRVLNPTTFQMAICSHGPVTAFLNAKTRG